MFNRSKYKPIMAAKYLSHKWMKYDGKVSVSLLDLYEDYKDWLVDNASGCDLEIAPFTKKINEVFPDAIVKDGEVRGITPYAPKPKPEPIKKTQLERDIEWILYYSCHNHPNLEYHGFTVEYILKEVSYHADAPQITEDQITNYLTKSDLYFQHPVKKYWLKEWRG
jgi:hypothetical protein